jgi:hypothetical protein
MRSASIISAYSTVFSDGGMKTACYRFLIDEE